MQPGKRILPLILALFMIWGLAGMSVASEPSGSKLQAQQLSLTRINVATGEKIALNAAQIVEVIVELSAPALLDVDPDNAQAYFAASETAIQNEIAAMGAKSLFGRLSTANKTLRDQQARVIKQVLSLTTEKTVLATYSAVMNGFAVRVPAGSVEKIKALSGVAGVYDVLTYDPPEVTINDPDDIYGNEMIAAAATWNDTGYTGKGQVIAVCDSGLDYNHPLFSAMAEHPLLKTQAELQAIIDKRELNCTSTTARYNMVNSGQSYRSNKVPFGFDYGVSNWDNNPMDDTSDPGHGTHVAGIAAANRTEDNAAIGVAPDAQIFAMKVFPNSNDTNILAAVDDAVKLGANSINLSLGSVAGFTDANSSSYANTYGRARAAGVSVFISSGNSSRSGERDASNYAENIVGRPLTNNLDYGMVGSPSTTRAVTTVASADNTHVYSPSFTIDNVDKKFMYIDTNPDNKKFAAAFSDKPYELAFIGLGDVGEAGEAGSLTGKIAVARRGGGISFVNKSIEAARAGAVGLLVVDNAPSGVISMVTEGAPIPLVSMTKADGEIVIEAVAAGNKTVRVNPRNEGIPSSASGYMSPFTSWGVTPDLKLKPELTASGGNVYSTYPVSMGSYTLMSGTSMSTPAVAGGGAVVQQRVQKDFPTFKGAARKLLVDNLMQSTATPIVLPDGHYASPRQQGAGMLNLKAAATSNVVLINDVDSRAKVELGDKLSANISFNVVAVNYGEDASFDLSALALTDGFYQSEIYGYVCEDYDIPLTSTASFEVGGKPVDSVTVPAGGVVTIHVSIALDEAEIADLTGRVFTNGMFVDGYVRLTAKGSYPSVGLPYIGYIGDWTKIPVYDKNLYEGTGLYNRDSATVPVRLGTTNYTVKAGCNPFAEDSVFNAELIAFSPSVSTNMADTLNYSATQLRNRTALNVSIYNEAGEMVRSVTNSTAQGRKTSYNGDTSTTASVNLGAFNGRVGTSGTSALLPDGKYSYVIKAAVDYAGSSIADNPLVKSFPFYIDTVAPKAERAYLTLENDREILSVETSDTHYVMEAILYAGSTVLDEQLFQVYDLEKDPVAKFDVTDILATYPSKADFLAAVGVEVGDMAWNFSQTMISSVFVDIDAPVVSQFSVTSPILTSLSAWLNIDIAGEKLGTLTLSSELFADHAVLPAVPGHNRIYLPAAPAEPGDYEVYLFSDDTVAATAVVRVNPYTPDIWTALCSEGPAGQLLVTFGADMLLPKSVTVNGTAAAYAMAGDRAVSVDVPFAALPAGSKVVLKGVKFPSLFPSYSFTFTAAK